jgi:hypothetical protein
MMPVSDECVILQISFKLLQLGTLLAGQANGFPGLYDKEHHDNDLDKSSSYHLFLLLINMLRDVRLISWI